MTMAAVAVGRPDRPATVARRSHDGDDGGAPVVGNRGFGNGGCR